MSEAISYAQTIPTASTKTSIRTIYEYTDYAEFLEDRLPTKGSLRGIRSQLAARLGCRISHLTQVIKGQSHLSSEYALATSRFLRLDPQAEDYFLTLVQRARSGSLDLSQYLDKKLNQMREDQKQITKRVGSSDHLSAVESVTYYSSWLYGAVHMMASVPQLQTIDAIARRLQIDIGHVQKMVHFLIQTGILKQGSNGSLATTGRRIHIKKGSPLLSKHHTNWRARTMQELNHEKSESLHFSAAYSIAKSDLPRIQRVLLEAIEHSEAVVRDSEQDTVCCLNMDLYEL